MNPDHEAAIKVENVSKVYRLWDSPAARLSAAAWEASADLCPWSTYLRDRCHERARSCYRDFKAVESIDLTVARGETLGIIGRNGSGKSTLLQIIAGTLQPTTGYVRVNGRVAALLELGAGFNPDFTGRENIFLYGAVVGMTPAEVEARFEEIARFADIGAFIEQPMKTYSTGMSVRVAFAVQSILEPDVLIVDEALAVGDEAFQRKCMSRIEALREKGTAIIFVSHAAQSVIQLCDRALMLDQGRAILLGDPKPVVQFYQKFLHSSAEQQAVLLSDPSHHAHATALQPEVESGPLHSLEFFSETLRSESRTSYEPHGARISDCRLDTPDGHPVNNLVVGRDYLFSYRVVFAIAAPKVAFGMMITTTQGIEVGGASTWAHQDKLRDFSTGDSVIVRFRFTCRLQEGTYFLRCGVANDASGFLHREVDVIALRVSSAFRRMQSGLADLGVRVLVSQTADSAALLEAAD